MKILFIGDVVGRPGRDSVVKWMPRLCGEFGIDIVVANGENAAGGLGATADTLAVLFEAGVHAVTLGNHTWRKKEFVRQIGGLDRVVRPANYPPGAPGVGWRVIETGSGHRLGVVNLIGRVFMEPFDCPFRVANTAIEVLRAETSCVLVDMHAEATAEKVAMGWHLDGRCTAVVGTHTHVQTADERVLPGGTAYITDVGMTGPADSVIGVERALVVRKFLTGMPTEFKVAVERPTLCGVVIDADEATGTARSIERVMRVDES